MSQDNNGGYDYKINDTFDQNNAIQTKEQKSNSKLIIILIIAMIISSVITYYLYSQYIDLSNRAVIMEDMIDTLNVKAIINDKMIDTLEKNNTINNNSLNRLLLSQSVDGGVVNDQFIIVKSTFYDEIAIIDLETQPSMSSQYKGEGNFSTEDRVLKKHLINLIDALKINYNQYNNNDMTAFENLKIYVTIKNYDIGTFESGTLTLSGE